MRVRVVLSVLFFALLVPVAAWADSGAGRGAEARMVAQVFSAKTLDHAWFSASDGLGATLFFTAAETVVEECHRKYGDFRDVHFVSPHHYRVGLSRGSCFAKIQLNGDGRIDEFEAGNSP